MTAEDKRLKERYAGIAKVLTVAMTEQHKILNLPKNRAKPPLTEVPRIQAYEGFKGEIAELDFEEHSLPFDPQRAKEEAVDCMNYLAAYIYQCDKMILEGK